MGVKTLDLNPTDVGKYFIYRSMTEDGNASITNLQLQKLVYYAYVYTLVKNGKKLFSEKIQAWVNGPVVPSLYQALKKYGRIPVPEEFIKDVDKLGYDKWLPATFPEDVLKTLDEVYEKYMTKTAFELVMLTHHEKPWLTARKGLAPTDNSENPISDTDILSEPSYQH